MSKGSKRRPGKGYEDNWDRIFKKEKKMEIVIYGKDHCPYCDKAVFLAKKICSENHENEYEYKKLGRDFDLHDLLELNKNARTFPQIFIDGECVGGYTEFSGLFNE